jgi:hypothetical protein
MLSRVSATSRRVLLVALGIVSITAVGFAQRGRWRQQQWMIDTELTDRRGVPDWENDKEFKDDVFTFVRIRYTADGWSKWHVDYPDSDLNFPWRLHELTSLQVSPKPIILDLTDERLFDYPFIYIIEPGTMMLTEPEVAGLRRYLLNGGFLMVDDFWGEEEWYGFYRNIKRVFPEFEPVELPLEHDIFHCVYDLKQKPQVPSIHAWYSGRTFERWDAQEPHYRGLFDDKGRMMAIICHNTDLGDGWEREGEDPGYFREMSEKWAYPLGINIVTYAMTH